MRANSYREVKEGDIVTVQEKKLPRQLWRLGKILRLIPGRDGAVISAVVKVKSRNGATEFKRPLSKTLPS